MVKVLIYSSKEIYDNSSYEGRAEADVIAYRINNIEYYVVKNRKQSIWFAGCKGEVATWHLHKHVNRLESDEWQRDMRDMDASKLQEKYKEHPLIELSKNG